MARQWNHASASQIRSALACRRRWWFVQISDLDAPPPTEAQQRGRTIHSAVEAALATGQAPTDDAVAAGLYTALCNLVGKDRTDATLHSERRIALRCGDHEIIGYIDLLAVNHRVQVYDYKTTSDWQYAQSPEQLANDVQMRVYAHAAALLHGVDEVEVIHVVAHKKTREIRETRVTLQADALRRWWHGPVEILLDELRQHAAARTADEVPADASACGQYGGCAYLDHCSAARKNDRDNPYKNIGAKDMSSLRDLIRERAAKGSSGPVAASQPAAAVTPAPAPAPAPAVAAAPQQSLVTDPTPTHKPAARATASMDYVAAADVLAVECRVVGKRLSAVELKRIVGGALGLQRVAWGHVEATVAAMAHLGIVGELSATAFVAGQVYGQPAAARVEPVADANPSGWPDPEPVADEVAPAPTPTPAPVVDEVAVVDEAPVVDEVAVVDEVVVVDEAPAPAPVIDELRLYIDCVPSCPWVSLEVVLAPIVERLSVQAGVHLFLLDYRQGERQLAQAVAAASPTGAIVVDSSHAAWRELAQVLVPRASLVVRGWR